MPGVNRQGQAHIVSTATASPDPRCAPGAGARLRTWFSIDPQPASISPTINISIVFICAFPVDCGRIICHPAIKNDSSAILLSEPGTFHDSCNSLARANQYTREGISSLKAGTRVRLPY